MVVALSVSVAVISAIALLCFKGIKINYNKTFTINDNRKILTVEQAETLEKKLNPDKTEDKKDISIRAPMDTVLGNIADIFGPEDKDGEDNE